MSVPPSPLPPLRSFLRLASQAGSRRLSIPPPVTILCFRSARGRERCGQVGARLMGSGGSGVVVSAELMGVSGGEVVG